MQHNEIHHPGFVVGWGLVPATVVEECREGPSQAYASNNYHCFRCLDVPLEAPPMELLDVEEHIQTE